MENLFVGKLVRLTKEEPEEAAKIQVRWAHDSEYQRLLDDGPSYIYSTKKIQEWIEKNQEKEGSKSVYFHIRTLKENQLIGFVGLGGISLNHRDAWMGIGIGDRQFWGKGYGSDVLRLILRYAFMELNLHRVTLGVFEYNKRAKRAYEKAGFKVEGTERQVLNRDGERKDVFIMGILRTEWEALLSAEPGK